MPKELKVKKKKKINLSYVSSAPATLRQDFTREFFILDQGMKKKI